ncbi:hypothetical protein [Nocardiopsis ganjiahuensis]|uniref:hypothetical protein n=1 Tax=Nocardiopsis ganjiahuensis TaxID=239984 RepID=UPI00034961C2|nr:hypothetical protein [Nocardiopsis ganjiahuensis]
MNLLLLARVVAAVIGVATFVYLFLHDSWHAENLFLVPDLVLCAALVAAALMPVRYARAALLFAFGLSAGVLMTSVSSYAVRGELGAVSLLGAITCAAFALVLAVSRPQTGGSSRADAPAAGS